MEKKIEKFKIDVTKLDERGAISLLSRASKMVDELSKLQDKFARESLIKTPKTRLSLSSKIHNLNREKLALQTKIEKRRPICKVLRKNETTVTTLMQNLGVFLKEFETSVPSVDAYRDEIFNTLKEKNEFTELLGEIMSGYPSGDIMAQLFRVFRSSIEETNEDKRYWLSKLKEQNEIAEAMGEYLKELNEIFDDTEDTDGTGGGKGDDSSDEGTMGYGIEYANIKLKKGSVSLQKVLDTLGEVLKERKEKEGEEEEETPTYFENFDQKANQLYNLLSSVMKAMNEMRMGTVRNIL